MAMQPMTTRRGEIITAADFEKAWPRQSWRGKPLADVCGVIVSADYVEAWEVLTREMISELDGLHETILENPDRPGTWKLQQRVDELQAALETRFAMKRAMQALTQYA